VFAAVLIDGGRCESYYSRCLIGKLDVAATKIGIADECLGVRAFREESRRGEAQGKEEKAAAERCAERML
jgi:hypothetical protein